MRQPRLLLLLLLGACSPRAADAHAPGNEFSGVYELGFERQTFRACGSTETWWVGTAPASLQRGLGTRAYVRVRGTLGLPGAFGHMGRYPRQLQITEVVADSRSPDCP